LKNSALSPQLLSSGHGLLEAPVFDPSLGLIVADADKGGVWSFPFGLPAKEIVSHRRGIGGMALHAEGGLVVSGRNVALKQITSEPSPGIELLANKPDNGIVGFNDLTTDPAGRIYVGSLAFHAMDVSPDEFSNKPAGRIHLIDLDGRAQSVAEGILLSNGMAFSPDARLLYVADSLRRSVLAYDVRDDGSLGTPKTFCHVTNGLPDGVAVAEDGSVWLAICHAGRIASYASDGDLMGEITFPVPMTTSLCFGGDNYQDLFVVSGSRGAPKELLGCVFRVAVNVRGLPRPKARIAIPHAMGAPVT
jgi:D-xylonolactonase